jgi:hypothetical protein
LHATQAKELVYYVDKPSAPGHLKGDWLEQDYDV